MYHDGNVVLSDDDWRYEHTVSLDDVCVLAINVVDYSSNFGLLASTSTGVVTNASWKCSSGVEQTGWHLPDFDDAAWSQAWVTSANGGSSSRFPGISWQADWIWVQDSSADIIYCRKSLC